MRSSHSRLRVEGFGVQVAGLSVLRRMFGDRVGIGDRSQS